MAVAGPAALRVLGAPVLVLALLLTGCGPADTAAPSPVGSTATSGGSSAAPTPAPPATSAAPSVEAAPWNVSGPSFGVDRFDWPDTIEGAEQLLAALPEQVSGKPRELYGDDSSGAFYPGLGEVFVQTEEDQEGPDELNSLDLLMAGFGLGAVCAEKSYRGTAAVPVLRKGEQEGALSSAAPGVQDGSTPAWFSCRPIAEDDEWGQAVGWTSGRTAWLLYARDAKAARTLITALHDADR